MQNVSQQTSPVGPIRTKADGSAFNYLAIPECQEGRKCANYSCWHYEAVKSTGLIETNLGVFTVITCLTCKTRYFPEGTKWQKIPRDNLSQSVSSANHCPDCECPPMEEGLFFEGTAISSKSTGVPIVARARFCCCEECKKIYLAY